MAANLRTEHTFDLDYNVGKEIGKGSFAVVKTATNKMNRKEYAVKIVDKGGLLEVEESRLKEEISLLRVVEHRNIIGMVAVYDEPAKYYLVMEKMRGDLLDRLARASVFSEPHAQANARQILQAIEHLHSHSIAHRDIKLENFLLESDDDAAFVKLADFGFAKRETAPNSFTTMCGTLAYVAREILQSKNYGKAVDVWAAGVVIFMLLGGYQPFRGEDDDSVTRSILSGILTFDEEFWGHVSDSAKHLICGMINGDPAERLSAKEALDHPWFTMDFQPREAFESEDDTPVFFMIGSQRSGSNWLRTMLDEREDLAGPHPPHMMREFMPIIEKFGDLSVETNFQILVDHVTNFVEHNQVPWTDKHENQIKFFRPRINQMAADSCRRVSASRSKRGDHTPLCAGMYLLSIFDAIMAMYTSVNGKRMWMCKSMGMSKFHHLLLEFYGAKRLRYIYLVRDPRDVAMSFMKTPVGDCHLYPIVKKWTGLQLHALKILEECPDLIHKVHYESILKEKEKTVGAIYRFIGERRFGGIKRQASVMFLPPAEDLISNAKLGREATKACGLSYQFKNLGRGGSFVKHQFQKFLDPTTGLQVDDLHIVESLAQEVMARLGYECHVVGKLFPAKEFAQDEIEEYDHLNQIGIEKMYGDLREENPADYDRRQRQEATLRRSVRRLELWDPKDVPIAEESTHSIFGNYLSEDELAARRFVDPTKTLTFSSGQRGRFATATQRGYYPSNASQTNQDCYKSNVDLGRGMKWFAVLDGHGPLGDKCSRAVAEDIPKRIFEAVKQDQRLDSALESSHKAAHKSILETEDAEQSGTTVASVVFSEDGSFVVSNVGDSTCILGTCDNSSGEWCAESLCRPHTPLLKDERRRIERAGGVIMTTEQRDGVEPMHQDWSSDKHKPPRVWSPSPHEKSPGCGFTRSIGDRFAHTLGVSALPEISATKTLDDNTCLLILASDGLTEFVENSECVRIAQQHRTNPLKAAEVLVKIATERWMMMGDSVDDITVTVIFIDSPTIHPNSSQPSASTNTCPEDFDLEWGEGTRAEKAGKDTAGDDNSQTGHTDVGPLGPKAQFWTLFAGAASGFLGGLCGIRGPPIILYFLHPPAPVVFEDKEAQRATGAAITATNVVMRLVYYLLRTLAFDGDSYFTGDDVSLYVSVILCSLAGVLVGTKIFEQIKDSKATIRGVLAIFLILCGGSLLLSSFGGI